MSEMYIINVQLIEKKTSEKRTKKQPKNSFICALKKQAIFNTIILSTTHTKTTTTTTTTTTTRATT